ncbi:MAG TPA: hypothetical protein VF272_03315 [Candidatus Saccharimonadia bacterium]
MTSIPAGITMGRYPPGIPRPGQEREYERLRLLVGTYQSIEVRRGHISPKVLLMGEPDGGVHRPSKVHRYDVKKGTPVWLKITSVTTDSNGWPMVTGSRNDTEFGFRPDYIYPLPILSLKIGS